jgi:hypothetical protein
MNKTNENGSPLPRRTFLSGAGVLLVGGVLGRSPVLAASPVPPPTAGTAPPLPWRWPVIDPMEAGTSAYHYYLDQGG